MVETEPRATPGRGHVTDCDSADGTLFPFLIWPWRWLWSCQWAYLSEDGTDKVTTSVSRECGAGRPSRCIFDCHVHSLHWVGHGQTSYLPPPRHTHNLHVDRNRISQFLEPQSPPLLPFPYFFPFFCFLSIHLEELSFSSWRLPSRVTLGHCYWSIRWLPIYFSVPRILFRTNWETTGGEVENEGLQFIEYSKDIVDEPWKKSHGKMQILSRCYWFYVLCLAPWLTSGHWPSSKKCGAGEGRVYWHLQRNRQLKRAT